MNFSPITPSCWGAVYLTSGDLWPGESWTEDITDACRLVDFILGLSDLWLVLKILKLDTKTKELKLINLYIINNYNIRYLKEYRYLLFSCHMKNV